jgi:hypothetical protein
MNLLGLLLDAQDSPALQQLAKNFGISETAAKQAVSEVAPALSRGLQHNISQQSGLEGLLGALKSGNHQRYLDQPDTLAGEAATTEGNAILGHILGGKDVSRRVASHAATRTGLDSGLLKKMLPVIATMVMGSMSKQAASSNLLDGPGGGSQASGATGLLTQFLDADKDGSVMDDLLGMAGRFMR